MEILQRERAITRSLFTKKNKVLRDSLECEDPDSDFIKVNFEVLKKYSCELSTLDEKYFQFMLAADSEEKELEDEKERAEEYLMHFLNTQFRCKKLQLSSLYDELETHLRALESLNVTRENCAPLLFPMIESALPEELLRIWQRYSLNTLHSNEPKDRLECIMNFLKNEVNSEIRVSMAVKGFDITETTETKKVKEECHLPTAASLSAAKIQLNCIFCEGNHDTVKCTKAKDMSIDDRQKIVKENAVCFRCLKKGHGVWKCRSNLSCGWCGGRHTLLMCRKITSTSDALALQENTEPSTSTENIEKNISNATINSDVFLQTLKIILKNGNKEKVVRAMIDSGSQRSYILRKVAKELCLEPTGKQTMVHGLFGGNTTSAEKHNIYSVSARRFDKDFEFKLKVYDKDVICSEVPHINTNNFKKELLNNYIFLSDTTGINDEISVLIGADMYANLMTGNVIIISKGVCAIETKLGWTVIGENHQKSHDSTLVVLSMFTGEASISDLWRLDVLGITDPIEMKSKEMHSEDVKRNFIESTNMNSDNRYEVMLPWKNNHPELLSNKNQALKRLENLTRKLKEEKLYDAYSKIFKDWLSEGIIEKVNNCEYGKSHYYLPHRHVVRLSSSTTPIRPVFDASARVKGSPSLNDCLETGPNLIEMIPSLLLRFRDKRIGVSADIRKAFQQISINELDRDVLRFLWWDDNDVVQVFRHSRVVFGVTSSPFLLGATIMLHLENTLKSTSSLSEQKRAIIGTLQSSFYVDNCIASVDNEKDLKRFRDTAVEVMSSGGFELRCWENSFDGTQIDMNTVTSVLGLKWDKAEDTLYLQEFCVTDVPDRVTKRLMLSISAKVFDIIGFVCPVLLCAKLFLREVCMKEMDWDDEVNEDIKIKFMQWYSDLNLLNKIKVPRWLFTCEEKEITKSFHVFVDASKLAYAVVIFVRTESVSSINVTFMQARSRVAPAKIASIPRLELLAANMGVRLLKSTTNKPPHSDYDIYFWSDSTTVLTWIKRNSHWATFVWNRVQEIRKSSDPSQWRYIPGEENPADLPSRGCSAKFLLESKWWEGPAWLRTPSKGWPVIDAVVDEVQVNAEARKCVNNVLVVQDKEDIWYMRYASNFIELSLG